MENSKAELYNIAVAAVANRAFVKAYDNSYVIASENCVVETYGYSMAQVTGYCTAKSFGYSTVKADGASTVEAHAFSQVLKESDSPDIKIFDSARVITPPNTVEQYCALWNVKIEDNKAILYKAVRNDFSSFHDDNFKYTIGETFAVTCDPDTGRECSEGLHIANIKFAVDFGRFEVKNFRILECAVPLDKIVVPKSSYGNYGKVRTSELKVLREVPKEEWEMHIPYGGED
jgi:hypothetical protein